MQLEKYNLLTGFTYHNCYSFTSSTETSILQTVIAYEQTKYYGMYNLGFGVLDPTNGTLDDKVITNNNDRNKILSTVASTIYDFTKTNTNATIFMSGSTPSRTRLYQIAITKEYDQISEDFEIFGLQNSIFEVFERNKRYEGFMVKRKKN